MSPQGVCQSAEIGGEFVAGGVERLEELRRRARWRWRHRRTCRQRGRRGRRRRRGGDILPQKTASEVATELTVQRKSHLRSRSICGASLAFRGSACGGLVPGLDERGDGLFEPRQVAIVGGGDQGIEREILFVLEDADGVEAARGFAAVFDIGGVVLAS